MIWSSTSGNRNTPTHSEVLQFEPTDSSASYFNYPLERETLTTTEFEQDAGSTEDYVSFAVTLRRIDLLSKKLFNVGACKIIDDYYVNYESDYVKRK